MTFSTRVGKAAVVFGVAAALMAATACRAPAGHAGSVPQVHDEVLARVVVQARGAAPRAVEAVEQAGGHVTRPLPLVDGVAAEVPAAALPALAATPGLIVTPDASVKVQGTVAGGATGTSAYRKVTGADQLAADGYDGTGVTVALVDTGIAAVPDLAGKVLPVRDDLTGAVKPCVNLSGERDCSDSYGHGTFMAGIIAGSGAASGGQYQGMAPGARLVSVKIAGRDGSADVSNVLAAIQWVVSFKDTYGIRVLNLSLGTDSTQSYRVDPLNYAVERAWAAGIAVVVAAANRGPGPGTISKPGDDPWVITVGAVDDRGTPGLGDDEVPDFTSRGPTASDGLAKPDLAAPGAHVVSLEAPGSSIATNVPTAMTNGYRKGSGTSMAAAVMSGASALLIGADPELTPDRLKFALTATARDGVDPDVNTVGAGVVSASLARTAPDGLANQGLDRSNGMGSLDASRGSVRVSTQGLLGTVLTGGQTAQLLLWDPIGFATGSWSTPSWYLSTWYLNGWYAVQWSGSKWQGSKWQGSKWQGQSNPTSTYGSKWQGSDWYGAWE
ncbi:MAG TPA: S8 family peptidase [Acidimicrobiales bacterium]|nr:S8 family peptidase [Acidimicrobiales bacterium]